jgi:endonuclease I
MNRIDCCVHGNGNGWRLNKETELLLKRWSKIDPVSQKEKNRNNKIFELYQRNRNPFIGFF